MTLQHSPGSGQRTPAGVLLFVIGLLLGLWYLNGRGCGKSEIPRDPNDEFLERMSRQNREYQRNLQNIDRANRGLPPLRTDD